MPQEKTLLQQGVAIWQQITGVDPHATSGTIGNWSLRETFEPLEEALTLDPTEITGIFLLAHFLNSFLADKSLSLATIIDDPTLIDRLLLKPRELRILLSSPDVLEARSSFVEGLRKAIARYGAGEREDINKLLDTQDQLAILRRDALRSMSQLRVDQFLDGDPELPGVKPVYNRMVHQFWNVNSLLAAATRMPAGVSLNLIRHPDAFQSYFSFVIRNGGNLFILSDVPANAHPPVPI